MGDTPLLQLAAQRKLRQIFKKPLEVYFIFKNEKQGLFLKNEKSGILFDEFVQKPVVIGENGPFSSSKCVFMAEIPLKKIFFALKCHLDCRVGRT